MVPMNSRTFNCDRFMANLFTTEWAHDHVETQLQLPISIPVVWHLRDVCFSFREKEFDFLWRFP